LDNPVANANELALFINFVRQEPGSYSASGTTLTLTEATSSSDDMYAIFLGKAIQTVNPPNASVGTSQLVDGAVTSAKLSAGKVLQVVSSTKTDTFSASVSYGANSSDITGLTLNITPTSTNSKIFLTSQINVCVSSTSGVHIFPYRDNSLLTGAVGDASGSKSRGFGSQTIDSLDQAETIGFNFLDSPNTTSQVTYSFRVGHNSGSTRTIYVNRSANDSNDVSIIRSASTVTAMEISG